MGHKPRAKMISFHLSDYDHQHERHCELTVFPETLSACFDWSMEINEDYLSSDDPDKPQPFSHSESIAFDSFTDLRRAIESALRDLSQACYQLYVDGSEADDIDEVLAMSFGDLDIEIPGNAAAGKVDVAALEAAYDQPLPEPLRGFLTSGDWRALDKKTALDLPGETINGKFLGVDHPVTIDFFGRTLIDNAALYRKPEMCAFAKFVGQGLGITYYGVVQADPAGDIVITTRFDDVHCIAQSPAELAEILDTPRKLKRKGRVRRVS